MIPSPGIPPLLPQGAGDEYVAAAVAGNMERIRALIRLGCPWGPPGRAFGEALDKGAGSQALNTMLGLGCPVDLEEARSSSVSAVLSDEVRWWLLQAEAPKSPERDEWEYYGPHSSYMDVVGDDEDLFRDPGASDL